VTPLAVRRWPLAVVFLFLAARVPLLFLRQPFFDELFTRWISAKSFAGIVHALRYDSGPPLYYWFVHLIGDPPLLVLRALSLLFASVALAVVMKMRIEAGALLAVFAPAVLLSVDARAYALCAMLIALALYAMERERWWTAAALLVLAAYSHYYGVLFFPLLLRRWRTFPVAVVLFIPGLWLAWNQPGSALDWLSMGEWPEALFVRPPMLLAIAIALLMIAAALRFNRFAVATLLPVALAVVCMVYVPVRFDAVIAVPLVLWLAPAKRVVLIPLGFALAVWTAVGIIEHAQRPVDDYRAAAEFVAHQPGPVVASGYLYLETVSLRPATAYPPHQAEHPGWRILRYPMGREIPPGAFLWIGERGAPELEVIRRHRRIEPLYENPTALVVKVH